MEPKLTETLPIYRKTLEVCHLILKITDNFPKRLLDNLGKSMLPLLKEWFPDDSDKMLEQKMVQLAVNWINDEDNPYGESKIWCYFSR